MFDKVNTKNTTQPMNLNGAFELKGTHALSKPFVNENVGIMGLQKEILKWWTSPHGSGKKKKKRAHDFCSITQNVAEG